MDLYFKKISVEQGLSQSSVNCFVEDQLGFIWVATDNGLNRFDGENFKVFRWKMGDNDGLSNSMVQDIKEDTEGNLWIGTAGGLNKYNPYTERFTKYPNTANINISNIHIDTTENKIWIAATTEGLKHLDLSTNKITTIPNKILDDAVVWDVCKSNNNELFIATMGNGVLKLDTKSMDISPFFQEINVPTNMAMEVLINGNELIVGTIGGGIIFYNLNTGDHSIFNQKNSDLNNDEVVCLMVDGNRLMIGTDGGGLNIMNLLDHSIATYQNDKSNPRSLSSNVVRNIFKDKNENYWIGTFNGGINFINGLSKYMQYVGKYHLNGNSMINNHVNCFLDDGSGGIWVGTNGGGLSYLRDGHFNSINSREPTHDLDDAVVMCMDIAPDEAMLIGTYRSGLNVYHNGQIKKYIHDSRDNTSISDNCVWALEVDKKGNYWVGTNSGLDKFDPKTGKFKHFKLSDDYTEIDIHNSIRSLYLDTEDQLWVGFFGGFGMLNLRTEKFEYFINKTFEECELSNDIVISIFEDHQQNLWLGTFGGGLNQFDKKSKTFQVYGEDDGFPSQIVLSIEEDAHFNLWISTINGLIKFNPEQQLFQVLDQSIGLQGETYNHNASLVDKNGYMYFGGINGYNVFHPDSISIPKDPKQVVITDIKLSNNSINPISHGFLMDQSIFFTEQIKLDFKESRFISVQFTSPNYGQPGKLHFAYKLEGFNEEWNNIGNLRDLTFTNLNPGNYTLKIKSSANNLWPDEYKELRLTIVPPFHLTKGFIFLMVVIGVMAVVGIVRYRTHLLTKRQTELKRLINQKNAEIKKQNADLLSKNLKLTAAQEQLKKTNNTLEEKVNNRTKRLKKTVDQLNKTVSELDRFVYSASHDISAPLKSIKGLVNIARHDNKDENLSIHLNYIEESILKLEQVIEELIQFSRNARSDIEYMEMDLNLFVHEVVDSLKFMPEYDQLRFEIHIPKKTKVLSDRQRMQMIVHNLLSNVIKYQDMDKEERKGWVSFERNKDSWSLEISDNGIGIAETHKENIFQMFYRATNASSGSGLGLFIAKEAMDKLNGTIRIKSKENVGTTFHLTFPIVEKV